MIPGGVGEGRGFTPGPGDPSVGVDPRLGIECDPLRPQRPIPDDGAVKGVVGDVVQ